MSCVHYIVEKLRAKLSYIREPFPFDDALPVVSPSEEFRDIDRAEIARIIKMQLLLSARVAGVDRTHRRHHMVMAIYLVDKDDARLGVFVSRRDYAVPDVGRIYHARHWRFFDGAI